MGTNRPIAEPCRELVERFKLTKQVMWNYPY